MENELMTATTRPRNARAKLLELQIAEREKTVVSLKDCWTHILRFAEAMNAVPIFNMRDRSIWLEEIDRQMKLSKELLEEKSI